MKRSTLCKRFITVLLTACLTASLFAANSYSDDADNPAADHVTGSYYGEGAFTEQTEQAYPAPQPEDLTGLRYIDFETLEKQGAIKRLPEKETLNTYAFLNRDGTESVVMFPDDIKYIDGSGAAVEKDITLIEAKSGGYTVKANDCGLLLPEDIKDGLSFSYSGGSIKLTPKNAKGPAVKEESSVSYCDVFGDKTILRYTPLLNGVKEDIVLNEYTGLSSFGFDLTTDKLWISDKEDRYVFVNENGDPVIEFGDVFAYDSAGKVVKGSLLVEKTEEGRDFSVTVTVPGKFLTDPGTVYPVTVDPTVHESSDGSAIQDAPVYGAAGYQNINFGAFLYNDIGNSSYGKARTAVRLYGLETDPIYRTLDAEEIVSVKLSVRETTGNTAKYVNLYRITDNVSWTESTVTWNNVGAFSTAVNAGGMLNQSARVEFDITSFAKGWKNLSYTNTMSVIFTMSGDETSYLKQFDSSECANTDRRPYVVFTYQLKNRLEEGIYYIRNRHIDKYLQPTNGSSLIGTGLELNAFSGNDAQKWEVISRGNGFYTVKNVSSEYVLSVPSGSYSTYDVQLTQTVDTQADGQLWRIYMTSYCGFAIKPKSACGPGDGTGWSDRTMSVADGNDGNGALVTQRPYVYNNSYKDEWYLVPTDIQTTGDYSIINRQLGTYLQPEGTIGYNNCTLALYGQTGMTSQKWHFTSVGNGYYKISPYGYSSYAISVASGDETTENGSVYVQSYSSNNPRQQWFVYKVPNGFVLKAKSSGINNLVLSVREGNLGNGAVVSQRAYVNNLSYKEEWLGFTPSGSTGMPSASSNKTYFVKNKATGLFLTQTAPMALVSSYTGSANQKWQFQDYHDGSVRLVSLSENTPTSGDNRFVVYASTSTSVYVSPGSASLIPDLKQGWIISGTDENATIRNKQFTNSYLGVSASLANLSLTENNYSRWELIECSNPYVLPSISNGDFKTDKYNTDGTEGLLHKMNCYAYAIGYYGGYAFDSVSDEFYDVQPGSLSGSIVEPDLSQFINIPSTNNYYLSPSGIDQYASSLVSALNADLQVLFDDDSDRVYFSSADEIMTGPWKKVALVLDTTAVSYNVAGEALIVGYDYHWYVEHSDGNWSQKHGLAEVDLLDESQVLINDPQFCDRNYNWLINYDYFVGYFKVKMDSVPDDVTAFKAFVEYDHAGDISSMAYNIGIVHHGLNYVYDTREAKIEYMAASSSYCADDYLGNTPIVNTFNWPADADWFEFMVESSGTYAIFSGGIGVDTYGVLLLNDEVIAEDNDSGSGFNFYFSVSLEAGQLYRICVAPLSTEDDSFEYYICFD